MTIKEKIQNFLRQTKIKYAAYSAGNLSKLTLLPVLRKERHGGMLFLPQTATRIDIDSDLYQLLLRIQKAKKPVALSQDERKILTKLSALAPEIFTSSGHLLPFRVCENSYAPSVVSIQITERCGNGCPQCYASSTVYGKDFSFADLLRLCSELASAGVCEVALGGGEPLLHPNLPLFLETFVAYGLLPHVTTSGVGLKPEHLSAMRRFCGAVALSLEDVGEAFSKRRFYGFSVFEHALFELSAVGIPVILHITLSADNFSRLPILVDYCIKQHTKLYGVIFLAYKAYGRGVDFDKPLSALPSEFVAQSLVDAWTRLEPYMRVGFDCGLVSYLRATQKYLGQQNLWEYQGFRAGCGAFAHNFAITPDLRVAGCSFLAHEPCGSLADTSLWQLLNKHYPNAFLAECERQCLRARC